MIWRNEKKNERNEKSSLTNNQENLNIKEKKRAALIWFAF